MFDSNSARMQVVLVITGVVLAGCSDAAEKVSGDTGSEPVAAFSPPIRTYMRSIHDMLATDLKQLASESGRIPTYSEAMASLCRREPDNEARLVLHEYIEIVPLESPELAYCMIYYGGRASQGEVNTLGPYFIRSGEIDRSAVRSHTLSLRGSDLVLKTR